MAKVILAQPAEVFPAYNPAKLILKATNGEEDVTMYFKIDGSAVSTHKREFFSLAEPLTDNFGNPITDNSGLPIPIGGDFVVVFDLGKIAKSYFSNALVEINAAVNATAAHMLAYQDRRLGIPVEVEIEGLDNASFLAANAALAPGVAEAEYVDRIDTFLTEFSKFRYYDGFSNTSRISVLIGASLGASLGAFTRLSIAGALTDPSEGPIFVLHYNYDGIADSLYVDYTAFVDLLEGVVTGLVGEKGILATRIAGTDSANIDPLMADITWEWLVGDTGEGVTVSAEYGAQESRQVLQYLSLSLGSPDGLEWTSELTNEEKVIASFDIPTLRLFGLYPTQYFIINVNGDEEARLPITIECIPAAPFYVRWVNRIGGREHWMFSKKQVEKSDITDSVVYEPYIETNADLGLAPRQLDLTYERSVVIGAEGVASADFEVLRLITASPMIEYYDTKISKWRVATIKGATIDYDLSSPVNGLEIELSLPNAATQF